MNGWDAYKTAGVGLTLAAVALLVVHPPKGPSGDTQGGGDVAAATAAVEGAAAAGSAHVESRAETSPGPDDGVAEGIQVHGHWTIEVREPDGEVVDRREFENALDPIGARSLVGILGRENVVGGWSVSLRGVSGDSPCLNQVNEPWPCVALEPSSTVELPYVFKTLAIEVVDVPLATLILSGSATAQRTTSITRVGTSLRLCLPSRDPASCPGTEDAVGGVFTGTGLSPIPVEAGQQILVTVEISFS